MAGTPPRSIVTGGCEKSHFFMVGIVKLILVYGSQLTSSLLYVVKEKISRIIFKKGLTFVYKNAILL